MHSYKEQTLSTRQEQHCVICGLAKGPAAETRYTHGMPCKAELDRQDDYMTW